MIPKNQRWLQRRDNDWQSSGKTNELSQTPETCAKLLHKRIVYRGNVGSVLDGTNRFPFVPVAGKISGVGVCVEAHYTHGLCLIIQHDDGKQVAVCPDELLIVG